MYACNREACQGLETTEADCDDGPNLGPNGGVYSTFFCFGLNRVNPHQHSVSIMIYFADI